MVLDSDYMLDSLGELVKDSKSQASASGSEIRTSGGGSGFRIFSRNSLGDSNSYLGLRPIDRSINLLGRPMNMTAEVGAQEKILFRWVI